MDCAFIQAVETWGSGGCIMDVVELKDGRILLVAEFGISVYANRAAFDQADPGTRIEPCLAHNVAAATI